MINVRDNVWKPSESFKYITNDDIYASEIHLRSGDDISNWHDTNDEPPEPSEEAEVQDYEESLERLGVEV